MGIPQVPDQVKRAPTLALRAVFSGIGRILLSADRPEANAAAPMAPALADLDQRRPPRGSRPERSGTARPAQPPARWRSLDQTGNVRLVSAAELDNDCDAEPAPAEASVVAPGAPSPVVSTSAADWRADATAEVLPLEHYDSLSLASLRARLRGLDVGQLRLLLDYERRNAERPEVLGMFERRIEKLESGA